MTLIPSRALKNASFFKNSGMTVNSSCSRSRLCAIIVLLFFKSSTFFSLRTTARTRYPLSRAIVSVLKPIYPVTPVIWSSLAWAHKYSTGEVLTRTCSLPTLCVVFDMIAAFEESRHMIKLAEAMSLFIFMRVIEKTASTMRLLALGVPGWRVRRL
jgi:hypothetical protein